MARAANGKPSVNRKKAQVLFHRLQEQGLGDSFRGMSEDQIVRAIKRTRAVIWQEKLAARP
ncbi:MAG TPA: hypothetical protein DCP69_03520 [Candidatus Omnitrophica bacterium]|nr:MAG: hypothetical protein A2105_02015 [Omnitrophica WOR_2 bacterium GWF2_63_9]OGX33212.1 MAG: hypothetical protein A3E56_00910 [Omnitrophica WOR_2 bacterium RIFCSPHIGHO2_12_FULL_64_13]HAM40415.1 hypothetical protein [Candidatus Omnitrophota bacterium]